LDPRFEVTVKRLTNTGVEVKYGGNGIVCLRMLYPLRQEEDAAVKPFLDERDRLLADPEIAKLRTQIEEQTKEMEAVRLAEKTMLLADVFGLHFRLKKFWYVLEVVFPSSLGLFAILVPAWKFWHPQ